MEKGETITQWVNAYGDELYSWAVYKVSDSDTAQDLVQETFLSAFSSFDTFKNLSSPKTWLFTILKNKITDHYRKRAKEEGLFSKENKAYINASDNLFNEHGHWKKGEYSTHNENWLDNPEFNNILSTCIEKLPGNWNFIVRAKYILDKESKDICQEIGITMSNYWQIIHRAKLLLKKCIETNWIS